jgi:hypothetical protein
MPGLAEGLLQAEVKLGLLGGSRCGEYVGSIKVYREKYKWAKL